MERVAFLREPDGERIECLLNPETVVVRRTAGLRPRRALGGGVGGGVTVDDPLLFTGGGSTELLLELLFDVSLAGSTVQTEDVRELTAPLWQLAENAQAEDGQARPPRVRFMWGKPWSVLGVVAAVSERLEHFTAFGAPRRSWLRMRLLRVDDTPSEAAPPAFSEGLTAEKVTEQLAPEDFVDHEVLGAGAAGGGTATGQRLDEIAAQAYGDPSLWRLIAELNNIADPTQLPPGSVLRLPSAAALRRVT